MKKYFASIILALGLLTINNDSLFSQTTYTQPGTIEWTVPPCVTEVTVKVWGAGGGGGAAWSKKDNPYNGYFEEILEACAAGGGGGGGAYTELTFAVTPGQTYTINVGAGGNGGTATSSQNSATDGQDGGTSSFSGNSINLVANGGEGGVGANMYNNTYNTIRTTIYDGIAGNGGTASGGSSNFTGGKGTAGHGGGSFDFGGAGGGGAGSNGNGGNGDATVENDPHIGGIGGTGAGNGANGKKIISGTTNGNSASGVGAAGGGAITHSIHGQNQKAQGGSGGNGKVVIEYTTDPTPSQPSPINGPTTVCVGDSEGYSVVLDPGATGYTWSYSGNGTISGNGNSITLNNITSGGVLTVSAANSCGDGEPQNIAITVETAPDLSAISGDAELCVGDNGSYTISNIPGVTYSWSYSGNGVISGSGNSINITNVTSSGTLTVTATNNCGSDTETFFINVNTKPDTPSPIEGEILIPCGTASGEYWVINDPNATNYNWGYTGDGDIVGSGSTIDLENIGSGGILGVTAENECGVSEPSTIVINLDETSATINGYDITNPHCDGDCNGQITALFSGGESTLTFQWFDAQGNPIGGNSPSINNLCAGTYTFVIYDGPNNGLNSPCTVTGQVTLVGPSPIDLSPVTVVHTSCAEDNGEITIHATGGTGVLNYSLNGGTPQTNNHFQNLSPGTYTITITDENGCEEIQTIVINSSNSPDKPEIQVINPTCDIDGYAIVTNYDNSYTYVVSPNGSVNSNGEIINAPGSYTISVIDGNGCESIINSFTLSPTLPTPTISVSINDPTECGGNGTIYLTFTDVPDGTYTINYDGGTFLNVIVSNGSATISAPAGTYNNITIFNGDCSASQGVSVSLTDPNAPNPPTVSTVGASCLSEGITTINNYSGNPADYSFSPSGPSINSSGEIINANPGTSYTITYTLNECTSAGTTFTNDAMLPTPSTPTISVQTPDCSADGEAVINNYDSNNTYTFSPSGPTVGVNGEIIGAVYGTTYTVTTTNTDNCESQASSSFTLEQILPTPTISISSDDPEECGGNGTIYFTFTGIEDGTYTINYDGGSYTITIVNGTASIQVGAGAYTNFIISNDDGCNSINGVSTTLTDPNAPNTPSITTEGATCDSQGTSTIDNYDSNINYTFSPSGPSVNSNGEIINANPGTNYSVTAEENGCTSGGTSFNIEDMLPPADTPTVTIEAATCSDNGTAEISNFDEDNSYTFSPTGPSVGANGEIIGADFGVDYTITSTNTEGCVSEVSTSFVIDEMLETPSISVTVEGPEECGGDGTITITFENVPDGVYDIEYSNGTFEGVTVTNGTATIYVGAGTYTDITISNGNCTSTDEITVSIADPNAPEAPEVNVGDPSCENDGIGTISDYTGDSSDYTFSPSGPSVNSNGEIINVNPETNYTITITENGCISSGTNFSVEAQLESPTLSYQPSEAEICQGDTIELTVSGAEQYQWSNGLGSSATIEVSPTENETYTVTGTNENGCSSQLTIPVTVHELPEIGINQGESASICYGSGITLEATGGNSYEWGNNLGNEDFVFVNPQENTTYEVTGYDENGCKNSTSILIIVNELPSFDENQNSSYSTCLGNSIDLAISNPNEEYNYTWIFNEEEIGTGTHYTVTNPSLNDEGVYTVIIENEEGCRITIEITLNITVCDIEITEVITPNGDGSNDYFYIEHLEAYPNTEVWIYNRWGAEVYYNENYLNDWDGKSQSKLNVGGDDLPEGTYYYILKLGGNESLPNSGEIYTGFVYIKR